MCFTKTEGRMNVPVQLAVFALSLHTSIISRKTFSSQIAHSLGSHSQHVSLGQKIPATLSEPKVAVSVQLAMLHQKHPLVKKVLWNHFKDFIRKQIHCLNKLLNLFICFVFGVC